MSFIENLKSLQRLKVLLRSVKIRRSYHDVLALGGPVTTYFTVNAFSCSGERLRERCLCAGRMRLRGSQNGGIRASTRRDPTSCDVVGLVGLRLSSSSSSSSTYSTISLRTLFHHQNAALPN